jgi:hypothetical protein
MPRPRQAVEGEFTPEEAARRRGAVIRRMANTPPQQRVGPKARAKAAVESAGGPELSHLPRGRGASAKSPDQG